MYARSDITETISDSRINAYLRIAMDPNLSIIRPDRGWNKDGAIVVTDSYNRSNSLLLS